jgi:DNA-binding NtrC family response regulator
LREDLFYRLNVFRIHIPPLRERSGDIPLLAQAIIGQMNEKHGSGITHLHPEALNRLMEHSWPGNVRELRNALEWATITSGEGVILPEHLPRNFGKPIHSPQPATTNDLEMDGFQFEPGRRLEDVETSYIQKTLELTGQNRKEAARRLGISLRTLYNRLSKTAPEPKPPHNIEDRFQKALSGS